MEQRQFIPRGSAEKQAKYSDAFRCPYFNPVNIQISDVLEKLQPAHNGHKEYLQKEFVCYCKTDYVLYLQRYMHRCKGSGLGM